MYNSTTPFTNSTVKNCRIIGLRTGEYEDGDIVKVIRRLHVNKSNDHDHDGMCTTFFIRKEPQLLG